MVMWMENNHRTGDGLLRTNSRLRGERSLARWHLKDGDRIYIFGDVADAGDDDR